MSLYLHIHMAAFVPVEQNVKQIYNVVHVGCRSPIETR